MYQTAERQTNAGDYNYTSGDVESHPVNVTPIPVAQRQSPMVDDLDVIMLDIIPGVYQVQSAYHIDDVNLYSQKIIRYAMGLCFFNVLISILVGIGGGGGATDVVDAIISIIFNFLILYAAIRCVRTKNSKCCCGLSALTFYRYFLMLNIFIISISIIILTAYISTGSFWRTIDLAYNLIVFILNCNQLRYSNKVVKALNVQVQPFNSRSSTAAATPLGTANATPTTAVVQSPPFYAQVEIDNSTNNSNTGGSRGW